MRVQKLAKGRVPAAAGSGKSAFSAVSMLVVAGLIAAPARAEGGRTEQWVGPGGLGALEIGLPVLNGEPRAAVGATRTAPISPQILIESKGPSDVHGYEEVGNAAPIVGDFDSFFDPADLPTYRPALNHTGQIAYPAVIDLGVDVLNGLYRSDPVPPAATNTVEITRENHDVADGNGFFESFLAQRIDDTGRVWFIAALGGTSGATPDTFGIYRGDGSADPSKLLRAGTDGPPDANGVFSGFGTGLHVNEFDQLAVLADIANTSGGVGVDDQGIYRFGPPPGGGLVVTEIARLGADAVVQTGTAPPEPIRQLHQPMIDSQGRAVFWAVTESGVVGTREAILCGDGATPRAVVAAQSSFVPGESTTVFERFREPVTNDSGQILYHGFWDETVNGFTRETSGLFLATPTSGTNFSTSVIVKVGDSARATMTRSIPSSAASAATRRPSRRAEPPRSPL